MFEHEPLVSLQKTLFLCEIILKKLKQILFWFDQQNLVLDQDSSSFHLISLNILITCLLNNVRIL